MFLVYFTFFRKIIIFHGDVVFDLYSGDYFDKFLINYNSMICV